MLDTKLSELMNRIGPDTFVISDIHFNHMGVTEWETSRLKDMHKQGIGLYVKDEPDR